MTDIPSVNEKPAEAPGKLKEIEEQPHHEGGAERLVGGVHAAFDQKRAGHADRDVEGRDEAEIQPVGPLERDPLAERAADRV